MNIFYTPIQREREYETLLSSLSSQLTAKNPRPLRVTGLSTGAGSAFCASLIKDMREKDSKCCLCLVHDEKEAVRALNILSDLKISAKMYPWRDFNFYDITASHEFEHERLSVLASIAEGSCEAVVAVIDAAMQYTMPRDILAKSTRTIDCSSVVELSELTQYLLSLGYVRTDMVDGAGQFSVRGGIVDIFPPQTENPVRIELFGTEVDSIGYFDILTQRRTELTDVLRITPAREVVVDAKAREELIRYCAGQKKRAKSERLSEIFSAELDVFENGLDARFIDKYISFVYPQRECLFDYIDGIYIFKEYAAASERIKAYQWRSEQDITALLEDGLIAPAFAEYGITSADLEEKLSNRAGVICDTFISGNSDIKSAGLFSFSTRQTVSYSDSFDLLAEDVNSFISAGVSTVILCENEIMAKNLRDLLAQRNINAVCGDFCDDIPSPANPLIIHGLNLPGYELISAKFALISTYPSRSGYSRTISSVKKRKNSNKTAKEKIMSYADLETGDFVVHASHGIGMYMGMDTVTASGITKDYLKIKYAGSDILYLPCDQLDMLSKYIGPHSEDGSVKLSKMGGAEWVKAKAQVKKATKEMAKELIRLYAERQRRPGFAFMPDDDMQREFESSFEYEETEGQLAAISEVKSDMEKTAPMDRLLCGDVGFGKTEVAMRAAFKAVESGKQVAILVPTTILAMQHYQTLLSRMRGFPVRIDMISRFRTPKQQEESLRKLKRGETDILVGTHRLVSNDVKFKDLGLVIVDEEQRFGVAHKEKLKQISDNVDVLTLSATPIPRTLNMAMSGIRDMSVLEEAPGDRVPVQTYVLEYDDIIIGDAIRKELRRGGQVFYLHNRVETMDRVLSTVKAMAPDARIAVAHGQMDKEMLSDIWRTMISGDTDILISTTIIESGVDIPNANTLIVEDSDHLGLSQLHQIRGRVGRSSRRAYAYFTYRKGSVLTDIASKRLSALRDYTEFGSGFKVALRDLEIRGAGNLLGAEQHGHIESVGYDLYMRLLNEAVLEEKGESAKPRIECTVDIGENAYIPESYIRVSSHRIDIYKKISLITCPEDRSDILDELIDRFGDPPAAVHSLLNISLIRAFGGQIGLTKIKRTESTVTFTPDTINAEHWTMLASEYRGRLLLSLGAKPYVTVKLKKGEKPAEFVCELLKKYIAISNGTEKEKKR